MKSLYVFLTGSRSATVWLRSVEVDVRLQPVASALAAEAGLLVAAERRGRVEPVEGVRPHHASPQTFGHPEDARAFLRPDPGAQSVRCVVRLLDRFLGRAEGQHRENRAEDLFLRDPIALRDVREDRRREPVALLGQAAGRLVDLSALFLARRDELFDLLELLARVDRADVGVLVERVADTERRQSPLQLLDQRLVDRFLHEQTGAGAANVALIEIDPVDDSLDRLVEGAVVEDDVRGLAAELERQLLLRAGQLALDPLADFGRPGEGDLVDLGLDERGARASVAGDDVDDTRRQLGLTK